LQAIRTRITISAARLLRPHAGSLQAPRLPVRLAAMIDPVLRDEQPHRKALMSPIKEARDAVLQAADELANAQLLAVPF
jgi:hypothetical protein